MQFALTASSSRGPFHKKRFQRDAEIYELLAGKSPGEVGMEVWDDPNDWHLTYTNMQAFHNARNPGTGLTYDINPNLWCLDVMDQLSGRQIAVKFSGEWQTLYGGVAVTRRHVIYCRHAGTPHVGHPVRFRNPDGTATDRTNIMGATYAATDMAIGLLNADLPLATNIIRIVPNVGPQGYDIGVIHFSRSWNEGLEYPTPTYPPLYGQPWPYNYPRYNQMMATFYAGSVRASAGVITGPGFSYGYWNGDSGTPKFILIDGELLFYGMVSGTSFYKDLAGQSPEDYLNQAITDVDAAAVTAGLLDSPTGYTVNIANDKLEKLSH